MASPPNPSGDHAILAAGVVEINRWHNANPHKSLSLRKAHIVDSNLSGSILSGADLSGSTFANCKLLDAKFDGASLKNVRFLGCDLSRTNFKGADVSSVEMSHCVLDGADFENTKAFSQIFSLLTCRVEDREKDVHFDQSRCRLLDRFVGWHRIRTVGQLRLFLPSYGALIVSIMTLSCVAALNDQLRFVQELGTELFERGVIGAEFLKKLFVVTQPIVPSWRHFAVLGSTLAIATGSTLYLFCPSRVREFTIDQWRFVAAQPGFSFYTHAWRLPATRAVCAAAYGIGALVAAALLGDTLIRLIKLLASGL